MVYICGVDLSGKTSVCSNVNGYVDRNKTIDELTSKFILPSIDLKKELDAPVIILTASHDELVIELALIYETKKHYFI